MPQEKGRIWQPGKIIITVGSLKGHHMKPGVPWDLALYCENLMQSQDIAADNL